MGAIRGILLVFVCVFLFLSLIFVNLFWTFGMSLEHDNVKVELGNFVDNLLENKNLETAVGDKFEIMQVYCQTNMEYVFEYDGSDYNFNIPCSVIVQGPNAVVSYLADDFIDEFYYKDYDCNFFDCFEKEGIFFLISEKAMDYWNSKFYFMLLVSVVLIGLVFLLAEKKSNTFVITGSLLIIASLLFAKIDLILSFFSDESLLALLTLFFSESYTVFITSLITGIVILAIGILLKIFRIGFKISDFFSKFSKKAENKEEPKEKKVISKKPKEKPKSVKKPRKFSFDFFKKKKSVKKSK